MRISDWSSDVCSSDLLNAHSVAKCLMPLLEDHDRERFENYCYSPKEVPNDRWQTAIQKAVHPFRFLVGRPAAEFARPIRDDAIDIMFGQNEVTHATRNTGMAFSAHPTQAKIRK